MKTRAIFLATLLISSIAVADEIAMVGMDDNGRPVEFVMEKSKYQKNLSAALDGVQIATLPVLNKHTLTGSWLMRTFILGVGFNIEAGIGPIVKLAAAPKFTVAFSNSTDPVLP